MKDSNGVVIVFNPDVPSHLKEIETWHAMFIAPQGLQDAQCLLISHHKPGSGDSDDRLPLGNTIVVITLIIIIIIMNLIQKAPFMALKDTVY
jgi:Rab-like protein 5